MAAVLATAFQCSPIKAGWDVLERAKPETQCIDTIRFFVGIGIPGALIDYALAAMAIQIVRRLQLKLAHKVGLVIMFLLCTV